MLTSFTRRQGMKYLVSLFGARAASWLVHLAADAPRKPARSVIMLWMSGGPATIDMWDLKPGHANGGPYCEISTKTPGLKISEHLPKMANWSEQMAIIRSMATKEGDHRRATILGQTGYVPQGSIQFPAIGALIAHERARADSELPGFVSISGGRDRVELGGGFLGPRFSPLVVSGQGGRGQGLARDMVDESRLQVPNLARAANVHDASQEERLRLLNAIDGSADEETPEAVVASIQSARESALRLMSKEAATTFNLDEEPVALQEAYGKSTFGQGCLLARRLIERGVPFVEVNLGGWDTHQENFRRVQELSTILDSGFSSLLGDLQSRGMLESTLVICMGEFGRTPRINGNQGRDHFPNAWSTVLAGGGIGGGKVVGQTSEDGMSVTDRPVTVPDLIATVCSALAIDPMKQNISNVARPIRIADPEAKPIKELL